MVIARRAPPLALALAPTARRTRQHEAACLTSSRFLPPAESSLRITRSFGTRWCADCSRSALVQEACPWLHMPPLRSVGPPVARRPRLIRRAVGAEGVCESAATRRDQHFARLLLSLRPFNSVVQPLPGRGKTHLICRAIGHELIQRGHRVLFVATYALVQRLLAAKRDLRLEHELVIPRRLRRIALDDIGYVQRSRDEMERCCSPFSPRGTSDAA
jgi:hypothetical protein